MSQHPKAQAAQPQRAGAVREFARGVRDGFAGDIRAATRWLFEDDVRARNVLALVAVTLALAVIALVLAFYFVAQ